MCNTPNWSTLNQWNDVVNVRIWNKCIPFHTNIHVYTLKTLTFIHQLQICFTFSTLTLWVSSPAVNQREMIPYYTVTERYRSFHSNIKIEQRFLMGCIDRNYTQTRSSMQTAERRKTREESDREREKRKIVEYRKTSSSSSSGSSRIV